MPTIGRYYFQVCTDGAQARGADVPALLRAAGIDPAALDDPLWRGSVAAMARLVREIRDALGDENMGYTRRPMPPGAFAFASSLMVEAATVGEGVARAIAFYNLASSDIVTTMREEGGECMIAMQLAEPQRDPRHYFSEFWLITWHRLACWLAGEVVPLHSATFDYPRPDYFEEFRYLFPCAHRFGAEGRGIVMDARPLHGPVRRTAAELATMLDRAPLDLMTVPATDHSLARRVRTLLVRDPALDATAVADALGIGPDGLRRRLRGEGRGLTEIREDVRRDMALRALLGGNRSVEAIAAELGYAEPRSFTRAFRAWTGQSPSDYRKRRAG
jgi:AraC-like DNA-binding protein